MTLQMKRYILGNGIWVDMNKKIISSIGALVFLVGSPMKASTPKPDIGLPTIRHQYSERLEFRYIIVSSTVNRDDPKLPVRIVEILLDEKKFSEDTLRKLYLLVSKRFPKPKDMQVWVYTSLDQIATPEEEGAPVASHIIKEDPNAPKHYKAFLLRRDGNELFWYYNLDGTESTTIVLKGRNPLIGKEK
jgi:hypothetical protein